MAMRSSIKDLPAEVLGMIFLEIAEHSKSHQCGLLVSVCRRWNDVVQNTPQLWSRLNVTTGKNTPLDSARYQKRLEKAKKTPLSIFIHVDFPTYQPDPIKGHLQRLYPALVQRQWRSLSIMGKTTLDPFEHLFRHILDSPQTCKLSSLRLVTNWGLTQSPTTLQLIREVLATALSISDLVIPFPFLEPACPLLSGLHHLQGKLGNGTEILRFLQETPLLQSLRLSCVSDVGDSAVEDMGSNGNTRCRLEAMECLDLICLDTLPQRLLQQLDLPGIHTLKLGDLWDNPKVGDREIDSFMTSVNWVGRIRSLTLENIEVAEKALISALGNLPVLTHLTLESQKTVGVKTTKALSQKATAKREWLCPHLQEVWFNSCRKLKGDDVEAFVEVRIRDVTTTAPRGVTDPSLVPPARLRKVFWDGRDMIARALGTG
ncbi:hypothetical protein FRB96_003998 [Tulasnella sp. 330]|nr:hypothetical protein FRB96_003998 [Tulasnella sp. 330]